MPKRLLILGGTGEARALANVLSEDTRFDVITSLAGRTDNPKLPDTEIRIGGFGGVDGLASYLKKEHIDLLIDATHPFAARISTNAFHATEQAGVDIIRLERPPWRAGDDDLWHHVPSLEDAVALVPQRSTVFITIGRQQLESFLDRDDIRVVARAIEGPKISLPDNWKMILARPPFTLDQEIALFRTHDIDVLVTKNAGGDETREKLLAARALQKPVIVIDRLPKPDVLTYETVDTLLASLNG